MLLTNLSKNDTKGSIAYLEGDREILSSYPQLWREGRQICSGLRDTGHPPRTPIILACDQLSNLLPAFWGCLFSGWIPLIVEVPPTTDSPNPALAKLEKIWEFLEKPPILIDSPEAKPFRQFAPVYDIASLRDFDAATTLYPSQPDDVAFLTLTSGSTGLPKCVRLTHRNVIARAMATNRLNGHRSDDIAFNWLPFDHIGSLSDWHIRCILAGCSVVYTSKDAVLRDPLFWLETIDRYRITHSWAPNFAYRLLANALETQSEKTWDLSCVKFLLAAGETLSQSAIGDCLRRLAPYGVRPDAIRPAFGMAELASGVTYYQPTPDAPLQFYAIEKNRLAGSVSPSASGSSSSNHLTVADLGTPISGVRLRIVAEDGSELPEDTVGRLQVGGEVVFDGYHRNPEATAKVMREGWFETGDLAFLHEGRLVLVGRDSETAIVRGVNFACSEIEAVVEELEGVEASYTAACPVCVSEAVGEQLAIFVHLDESSQELSLIRQIRKRVSLEVGVTPDFVIPVEKAAIPKTAIGKIQRRQLTQLFEAGNFDEIVGRIEGLLSAIPPVRVSNDGERDIAEVWKAVLGIDRFGVTDNFFELGGNSLKLLQVQQQLQGRFHREIPVAELFRYPTVATLAGWLAESPESAVLGLQVSASASRLPRDTADIAVIGLAGRFPGSDDLKRFWENLCDGVESISQLSEAEILASGISPDLLNHPDYVKASPILSDVEGFDAEFFGYSPKEAALLDPQQRLLLECAWETLENAGYAPNGYPGSVGMFAGGVTNTYLLNNVYPNRHRLDDIDDLGVVTLDSVGGFQLMVANDKDYLPTRVSYKLNFTGPSVNVQTACSTSLVAVHLACQSLLRGECDIALAGGVSVRVPQKVGYLYREGSIVSPDGCCRAFDEKAGGTIFGSGVGLVALKPLERAIADGDRIYAVVKGSAIANDGGQKVGYLAPNGDGQARVVFDALQRSGVSADSIEYIETHGTGTVLGDPIEIAGLTRAFRQFTQNRGFCAVGSVKTNVGHLQIASGIVGLIKTVLMLHHGKIPPSLHCDTPNPQIDFANSPFFVNTKLRDWNSGKQPRRAGVNSLGVGGTNVHVVLEESPSRDFDENRDSANSRPVSILTLSAKTDTALRELAKRYEAALGDFPDAVLGDICFTANTGRTHFEKRFAAVSDNVEGLRRQLGEFVGGGISRTSVKAGKWVFLFPGQGSQYPGMGKPLYDRYSIFREAIDLCDELLDFSLVEVLYGNGERETGNLETPYVQPALFAVEYALAKLWMSWGVVPEVMGGHSLGEYVAACLADVFSLEDGLRLVAARGKCFAKLPARGGLLAVFAGAERLRGFLVNTRLEIAAFNGSRNTVVSGSREEIASLARDLEESGISSTVLRVSHGFHSALVEPILEEFAEIARSIAYRPPRRKLLSMVTGDFIDADIANPDYWVRHLRQPVRFQQGIDSLSRQGYCCILEVGAKPVLLPMLSEFEGVKLASLHPKTPWKTLLKTVAQLYRNGVSLNWNAIESSGNYRRLPLPTYPFERKRHWLDAPSSGSRSPISTVAVSGNSSLLGNRLSSPLASRIFQNSLSLETHRFFEDHTVNGEVIFPGAGYVEIGLELQSELSQDIVLENLRFDRPLSLSLSPRIIQTILEPNGEFSIYSQTDSETWILQASGKIQPLQLPNSQSVDLTKLREQFQNTLSRNEWISHCQTRGLTYGETFQSVEAIQISSNRAFAEIKLPDSGVQNRNTVLLDGCFQTLLAAIPDGGLQVPVGIDRIAIYQPLPERLFCDAKLSHKANQNRFYGNLDIYDSHGVLVAKIEGLASQSIAPPNIPPNIPPNPPLKGGRSGDRGRRGDRGLRGDWLYEVGWQKTPKPDFQTAEIGKILVISEDEILGEKLVGTLPESAIEPATRLDIPNALNSPLREVGGVVYIPNPDSFETAIDRTRRRLLHLSQQLIDISETPPRLWVVTRGVQAVGRYPGIGNVSLSYIAGFIETLAIEHPQLQPCTIDLDPFDREISPLVAELAQPPDETNTAFESSQTLHAIALREGERWTAHIRHRQPPTAPPTSPQHLQITQRGTLDNLTWRDIQRRPPNPDEIEIRVQATGLNFRDVLNVLGEYPGNAGELGWECAGEVVAVGTHVTEFQRGEAVCAVATGAFSQYVTLNAAWAVSKPPNLGIEAAATVPGAFLTAFYALHHLAQLQPSERILVHSAAGGVGLAAVRLAQHLGAEVLATASPPKQGFLKSLGIECVASSRSLDFADRVRQYTGGEGVDVVLNSLSGAFVEESLSLLREGGRFVELGKRDVSHAATSSVLTMDLLEVMQRQPNLVRSMLREIAALLGSERIQPLPVKTMTSDRTSDAFRILQNAQHIGKIAITPPHALEIRPDATYLVVGGFGGLGWEVVRWLVRRGAQHLAVVNSRRHQPPEALGIDLRSYCVDVAQYEELAAVLRDIEAAQPPLRGVVHAAGVLDDAVIRRLTDAQFDRVFSPKVRGAWNLHRLTQNLDFFWLFSSMAAWGSAGQAHYAAANAFLDGLARYRRGRGLPATSINWGPWAEVGLAATPELGKRFRRRGLGTIPPSQGLAVLDWLLFQPETQIGVVPWETQAQLSPQPSPPTPLSKGGEGGIGTKEGWTAMGSQLRQSRLLEVVKQQLATVLGMVATEDLEMSRGWTEMGLDSLAAVEFRNRLQIQLGVALPATITFDCPTPAKLVVYLNRRLEASPAEASERVSDQEARIRQLSAEEAEAQLLEALEEFGDLE
ncbi:SDR family NAD(P)-dependent oxidoreductase [Baaleninema sp.]|uniref:SDR family NAD(P)-dependent oxidoreductase n=1 Tax=Baaleninema sp. TaxID=3101197 RepID=UPI003D0209C7